jgi:hypothetical protein
MRAPLARVALPHPAFEARFEVYSDDPAVAREVVGPGFCDAMVALADAHRGRPIQGAFRGRSFRLGSLLRSRDGLAGDMGHVLQEVRIVHRVIDALHGDHS